MTAQPDAASHAAIHKSWGAALESHLQCSCAAHRYSEFYLKICALHGKRNVWRWSGSLTIFCVKHQTGQGHQRSLALFHASHPAIGGATLTFLQILFGFDWGEGVQHPMAVK